MPCTHRTVATTDFRAKLGTDWSDAVSIETVQPTACEEGADGARARAVVGAVVSGTIQSNAVIPGAFSGIFVAVVAYATPSPATRSATFAVDAVWSNASSRGAIRRRASAGGGASGPKASEGNAKDGSAPAIDAGGSSAIPIVGGRKACSARNGAR